MIKYELRPERTEGGILTVQTKLNGRWDWLNLTETQREKLREASESYLNRIVRGEAELKTIRGEI